MPSAHAVLHETEVDGVRCLWVDSGRPTLAAALSFRQGTADESLVESGWLHLLEHLALEGRESPTLHVNGSTGLLRTEFEAHGPAAAVGAFLGAVTAWLNDPRIDDLAHEAGVLRAERSVRGIGVGRSALAWRYGARGPASGSFGEPGLTRASVDGLRELSRRVFTRGNAVLMLDGPPPPELRLHLPAGDLILPRPARCVKSRLPAAYPGQPGEILLSGEVPRSRSAVMVPDLLRSALTTAFRVEGGGAYAPWATHEAVDGDHAVVIAGSDVNPSLVPGVMTEVYRIVGDLGRDGPRPDRLADVVAQRIQAWEDPYAVFQLARRAGEAALDRQPVPRSIDELIDDLRAIGVEEVREDLASMSRTLLLAGPPGTGTPDHLPTLRYPSSMASPDGEGFRSVDWPADTRILRIGPSWVESQEDAYARRVDLMDLEAVNASPDGYRFLLRSDGYGLEVDALDWRDGARAIALIDAMVPPALVIPEAAPDRARIRPRLPVTTRWRVGVSRFARTTTGVYVLTTIPLLVAVAVVLLLLETGHATRLAPYFLGGVVLLGFVLRRLLPTGDRSTWRP